MHPCNLHINSQHVVLKEAGSITFTLNVIIIFVVCMGLLIIRYVLYKPVNIDVQTVLKYHATLQYISTCVSTSPPTSVP